MRKIWAGVAVGWGWKWKVREASSGGTPQGPYSVLCHARISLGIGFLHSAYAAGAGAPQSPLWTLMTRRQKLRLQTQEHAGILCTTSNEYILWNTGREKGCHEWSLSQEVNEMTTLQTFKMFVRRVSQQAVKPCTAGELGEKIFTLAKAWTCWQWL